MHGWGSFMAHLHSVENNQEKALIKLSPLSGKNKRATAIYF